jgi:hypothetical protein
MKDTTTTESIKKGDTVTWLESSYSVIEIIKEEALLQQNFSLGTVLMEGVPLKELTLVTS